MKEFEPPTFRPHPLFRGGHLQTIASLRSPSETLVPEAAHQIDLPDGDAIVLHENRPVDGARSKITASAVASDANGADRDGADKDSVENVILLAHGLSGCHGSPYMVRWARRLTETGWTVYRMDLRGCGAAKPFARGISHAGRSDDLRAGLDWIAHRHSSARIAAAAVSLGGNQLLRLAGRIGAGLDQQPAWMDRWAGLAVVAPPIDLVRCSENMSRLSRRLYNYYFIRTLFERIPPRIESHDLFAAVASGGRPKDLYELDDRLTAPLSGFAGAEDYYQQCGAIAVTGANPLRTLVLVADDDPIVPVGCFENADWPRKTRLIRKKTGGHAGFVERAGGAWMDRCVVGWLNRL